MNAKNGLWAIVIAGSAASFSCLADTVILSDGREIDGTVIENSSSAVVVKRPNGAVQSFRRQDVEVVVVERKKPVAPPPKKTAAAAKPEAAEKPAAKKAEASQPERLPSDLERIARGEQIIAPETAEAPETATPLEQPENGAETAKPPENTEATEKPQPTEAKAAEEPATEPGKVTAAGDEKTEQPEPEKAKPSEKEPEVTAEEEWTAPPGLSGFPEYAERMSKEDEAFFMQQLELLATTDEGQRSKARGAITTLGAQVLPYLVAASQHTHVEARSSAMYLIGDLNGRTVVKYVIEVFYSAMPETGETPTWQVPFIRAVKTTLPKITGESFISVEPGSAFVQNGLKKYIEWYDANFDRLPPQLGEEYIEPTDPEYVTRLKEVRALKLQKREWPRPAIGEEAVKAPGDNRQRPTADQIYRDQDKRRNDTAPVSRDDAYSRKRR